MANVDGVVVELRGSGHHDRADAAASLIRRLRTVGAVTVSTELRPRLAADVEAMLDSGADGVMLGGEASAGVFRRDGRNRVERESDLSAAILLRLVAGAGPVAASVSGDGPLADDVRAAVRDWVPDE